MDYRIRRSDRARRVRVTVEPDGSVVVTLPRRAAERQAAAAVQELAPWIARRRAQVAAARTAAQREPGTVPYLGETLTLRPEPGRTRAHRHADALLVPADQEQRHLALERWYRRRAAAEIGPRLDAACAQAGLRYSGLTIRGQKTRWASCSARGAMSFNWRLLLAPPEILDYVVWHEVCHLAHMDHSPRFWGLLAQHRPGYERERAWLRSYGATLVL
ncbi:MAG TPA: SprT family zinc-dependent metalloprotease [Solirubrobacteraceae bacterium]|nr:SprT family zinc-dependent metalloprotease [Solirubrobacteraceae bacterium]